MLNRRNALIYTCFGLAGCSMSASNTPELTTVQAYADDLILAVAAAAQKQKATSVGATLVSRTITALLALKTAIDGAVNVSDARSIVVSIITAVQQVTPFLAPLMGAAAPFVPVALAVLQAFISALAMPPGAPVSPPAELHRAALTYNHH